MHLSDNAFHDWCMQEFPDLKRHTRHNIMLVGKRFGGVEFVQHQLPITVLYELAAPSVPDELVEALQVLVDNQEDEREAILLVLGRQLLSGRKPFEGENGKLKDQRGYGKWISRNFTDLREIVSLVNGAKPTFQTCRSKLAQKRSGPYCGPQSFLI